MSSLESLEGIKVLVIDDCADTLASLHDLLEGMRATVTTARSGPEALAHLKTFRPDVIVSDIGMPDCDGYQLMRMVRVRGAEEGGATAAIALTGHATNGDHTRALLAGFSAHIAKPFAPKVLCAAIQRLARAHGRSCSLG
ncbi:MAG: response regulator [Myxococcota bacterium]|nr:response regulator [Deltaproteobacteria bacterium]MDQ3334816.1 response regulator [Myxococcota bacterium]